MKPEIRKILHELTTWQVAAATFCNATFYRSSPKHKRMQCRLGDEPSKFPEYTARELMELFYTDSDYYKVTKLSKSKTMTHMEWHDYPSKLLNNESVMAIVKAFNDKSSTRFFGRDIPGVPIPLIGPLLPSLSGKEDKVYRICRNALDHHQNYIYWRSKALSCDKLALRQAYSHLHSIDDPKHKTAFADIYNTAVNHANMMTDSLTISEAAFTDRDAAIALSKKMKRKRLDPFSMAPLYVPEEDDDLGAST